MHPWVLVVIAAIFGLCVGSFLNVCIYRIPQSKSIVRPGSMCMQCGRPIAFYHNIPVLSYLWLKGRCRHCRTPISMRYPMVELMGGLFAVCSLLKFGPTVAGLIYYALVCTLLVVTFIDIDYQIIPDRITLPGIPIAVAAGLALPQLSLIDSLLGLLAGGGSLYLVALIYQWATGKEGMGGGDIKLLALIGALVGWRGVLFTVFAASLTGTIVGLAVMVHRGKNMKLAVPFGPFLSIGAIAYVYFGPEAIAWYFNLL